MVAYVNAAVALIVILSAIAAGVWINAKKLDVQRDANRRGTDGEAVRSEVKMLTNENRDLKDQISYLEERIGVLERIATDPAERTAREIEQLR